MAIKRRKRLPDGSLGPLEKVNEGETKEEKIERLEAENAQLFYDSMMKDLKIEELTNSQAELLYQLMKKGVL